MPLRRMPASALPWTSGVRRIEQKSRGVVPLDFFVYELFIVFAIFGLFNYFLKRQVHIEWYRKDQLVTIWVKYYDLTDIPWLVGGANHSRAVLTSMSGKSIHVAVEVVEQIEVQRYAHTSGLG